MAIKVYYGLAAIIVVKRFKFHVIVDVKCTQLPFEVPIFDSFFCIWLKALLRFP